MTGFATRGAREEGRKRKNELSRTETQISGRDAMAARLALRRAARAVGPDFERGSHILLDVARRSIDGLRGVTTAANELRVGAIVQKDGNLLKVTKHSYTQGQARSSGNVQVEYRDLRTGGKVQDRLSPSDKVQRASLESEEYDYLYDDGTTATAMHPVSFEQIEFPLDELGTTARRFLAEGCVLKVLSFEGERISASLPDEVELEVVEADPSVKGESQDKQFKAAKVGEHEAVVRVPAFVEAGDRIVVDTTSGNFVRRVR